MSQSTVCFLIVLLVSFLWLGWIYYIKVILTQDIKVQKVMICWTSSAEDVIHSRASSDWSCVSEHTKL